jgi:murein DD-endopeptidase MepM/ murein hydrolase activator NlpD
MGLLDGPQKAHDPESAARALDSLMVKQMLSASGAFKGSALAGSSLHADLFVEALADAVAKSGGLGVGELALPSHAATLPPPPQQPPQSATALAAPLPEGSARKTSGFGPRQDPIDGHAGRHRGVDLAAAEGTPVLAAAAGTVKRAGVRGGYGEMVEIDHGDGLTTVYAHASALLVREGEQVEQGRPIALVGASGHATSAHLHFEVRHRGKAVDPQHALKAYANRAEESAEGDPPLSSRGRSP